jgi:hypothetical protein
MLCNAYIISFHVFMPSQRSVPSTPIAGLSHCTLLANASSRHVSPEDGGSMFLRNFVIHLQNYGIEPKRPQSEQRYRLSSVYCVSCYENSNINILVFIFGCNIKRPTLFCFFLSPFLHFYAVETVGTFWLKEFHIALEGPLSSCIKTLSLTY